MVSDVLKYMRTLKILTTIYNPAKDVLYTMRILEKLKNNKLLKIFMIILLVMITFIRINKGVDFADTGYNLANYENFPHVNHTWMISTILSMCIGKLLTLLPFGHLMLGMKIYCAILSSAFIVFFFLFISKEFDIFSVFTGEAIALLISWCPNVILYHCLSYYFFALSGLLLIKALGSGKLRTLILSAVILSLNVFICFPNICGMGLATIIIFDMIIEKRNKFKEFFIFFAGYFGTLIAGILIIDAVLGWGSYSSMIKELFAMTGTATSYALPSMLLTIIDGYRWDIWYFLILLFVSILTAFLYSRFKNKAIRIIIIVFSVLASLAVLRVMRYYGRISFDYTSHFAYYSLAVILILFSILVSLISCFNQKLNVVQRLLAFLSSPSS